MWSSRHEVVPCALARGGRCVPEVLLHLFSSVAVWESISSAQTSAPACPVGNNPPTNAPGLHPPHGPILRVSPFPQGPSVPMYRWRNGGGCMESPRVAIHGERCERTWPHVALIWGRRIRRKQGRAEGDIWLLEPLAPISTYQVKILASS